MITIKCGECKAAVYDRSKSTYNSKEDEFFCNTDCEEKFLDNKNKLAATIECELDSNMEGQYYIKF